MHFEKLNLNPSIMKGVHELGFVELTPIQEQSIPPILNGKDVIGLAQTGTGKTAAFVLPILQRCLDLPRRQVNAVIISPTRELTEQICDTVASLGKYTGLKSIALYGGTNINNQINELGRGAEIVVACPGRLIDHLWRGSIDLSHLDILVIDEADRMFDMGFQPDIRRILSCILQKKQTLLFSATMPDPIRKLVKEILVDPVTVQIGQTAPAKSVSHSLYPVSQNQKTALLTELLYRLESQSVLVFTRTKIKAERITRHLKDCGFRAASLQGDLTQPQRQAAIDGFRSGRVKILVATDIAARGIDIDHISHVINYDMPENTDAYIHRIGRTGRVNKEGEAFTFVTSADTAMVNSIEQVLKKTIDRRTIDGFDYSKAAPEKETKSRKPAGIRRGPGSGSRPVNRRRPKLQKGATV
ncbi:MAG: DEAD/DEAH box helicase [Dehalococcoidales bacterium]|jgi:ATP-dependent RNA helicase RhlE|nr:DEAD/DEAH box helicase [Dehalococcoidales bacterium]